MAKAFDQWIAKPLLVCLPRWIHPHHLTVLRAALVIPVILCQSIGWLAVAFLLVSSACDILDGSLARVRGQTTEEGASLDALSDKVFIYGSLFFACADRMSFSIRWIMLVLDVALTLMRPLKRWLGVTARSNRWGGFKIWAQSFGVAFVLTQNPTLLSASHPSFLLAIVLAILSLGGHARDIVRRKTSC